MGAAGVKVEIWSGVACPWCYIGERRFEAALARFPHPVDVVWKSFELDPHAVGGKDGDLATRLAAKYSRTVCLATYSDAVDEVLDARAAEAHSGIPASLAAVKRTAEG